MTDTTPTDASPEQIAVARDRAFAAGDDATAGNLTTRLAESGADLGQLDYRKAFVVPADPDAAALRLAELQADKAFVDSLFDPSHPLHKANTAQRQVLLDAMTGAPAVQAADGTIKAGDYKVHRDVPPSEWDHDAETFLRDVSSALGLEQSAFDQIVYAYNTAVRDPSAVGSEEACRAEMEKRYGDALPSKLAAFREMIASLGSERQADVLFMLGSSGLGNSVPFAEIALAHAEAWKSRKATKH
jgi:hypothetical protein